MELPSCVLVAAEAAVVPHWPSLLAGTPPQGDFSSLAASKLLERRAAEGNLTAS